VTFRISIPEHLHRNSKGVAAAGYEETGLQLIELATRRAGLATLADTDVLDVGCGVRFTQTIVNRGLAVRSYVGIEVSGPIVDFLRREVEPFDTRFRFVHWDVHHAVFNDGATKRLEDEAALPVDGSFDLIWLFSVFTHLDATDARTMLRLARRRVRPEGTLLFTAFIDPDLDGVESRGSSHPLHMVFYGRRTMEALIRETGWRLQGFYAGGEKNYIQPCFVCAPEPLT
jgi:SAM-dependent methyltransferase